MSEESLTFKDAALRAVGRTVVNFQRLEHNLKTVARLGPLEGVLPKIQRDMEERAKKAASYSLGQAIHAWLRVIDPDDSRDRRTPDLLDPTMRVTFVLEVDEESQRAHGEALRALLEFRNSLIHGRLARFNWDSRDECDQLVEELNETNDTIKVQIDFLAAVAKSFQGLRSEDVTIEESTGIS